MSSLVVIRHVVVTFHRLLRTDLHNVLILHPVGGGGGGGGGVEIGRKTSGGADKIEKYL